MACVDRTALHAGFDHLRREKVGLALFVHGNLAKVFQQDGADRLGRVLRACVDQQRWPWIVSLGNKLPLDAGKCTKRTLYRHVHGSVVPSKQPGPQRRSQSAHSRNEAIRGAGLKRGVGRTHTSR